MQLLNKENLNIINMMASFARIHVELHSFTFLIFSIIKEVLDMSNEKSLLERITINPEINHGKPTIRGMRYPVESMLEYLAGGDSVSDILEEFTDLEEEDILACLAYATASVKSKGTVIIPFAE